MIIPRLRQTQHRPWFDREFGFIECRIAIVMVGEVVQAVAVGHELDRGFRPNVLSSDLHQ